MTLQKPGVSNNTKRNKKCRPWVFIIEDDASVTDGSL